MHSVGDVPDLDDDTRSAEFAGEKRRRARR
jgi:hypothetical protein